MTLRLPHRQVISKTAMPSRTKVAAGFLDEALRSIELPESEIVLSIERRSPDFALRGLDMSAVEATVRVWLAPVLVDQLGVSGTKEAKHGKYVTKVAKATSTLNFVFDVENPAVGRWAATRSGQLIVEITERTRDAIRELIATATNEGQNPLVVAPVIRQAIGLHSRWATAVLRYQQNLTTSGLASEKVRSLTSTYFDKLLKTRSETIARTEILSAENQGKAAAWDQARAAGLFGTVQEPLKEWVASGDAEEVCAGLDGTQVGLDEDFPGDEFGDTDMPPLHPNCRCTAVLILPDGTETTEEGE